MSYADGVSQEIGQGLLWGFGLALATLAGLLVLGWVMKAVQRHDPRMPRLKEQFATLKQFLNRCGRRFGERRGRVDQLRREHGLLKAEIRRLEQLEARLRLRRVETVRLVGDERGGRYRFIAHVSNRRFELSAGSYRGTKWAPEEWSGGHRVVIWAAHRDEAEQRLAGTYSTFEGFKIQDLAEAPEDLGTSRGTESERTNGSGSVDSVGDDDAGAGRRSA